MVYFSNRDITAVTMSATLWAVLNWLITPIFWNLTHLPILCDMIGVSLLVLTAWWTGKPGAASFMGALATLLNYVLRPDSPHFVGFTVASVFFDIAVSAIGNERVMGGGKLGNAVLMSISVLSAMVAGSIIGAFFMNPQILSAMFGGAAIFAVIHGAGGLVGGVLGVLIVRGLEARQVFVRQM